MLLCVWIIYRDSTRSSSFIFLSPVFLFFGPICQSVHPLWCSKPPPLRFRSLPLYPLQSFFFISTPPPPYAIPFSRVWLRLRLSPPRSCIPAPFSVYQTRQAHYDFISQTTLASPFSPCWGSAGSVLLYNFHNGTWKATYRAAGEITCSAWLNMNNYSPFHVARTND